MRSMLVWIAMTAIVSRTSAQTAEPDPEVKVHLDPAADDVLLRRVEDFHPRIPNPNGSNAGTTPGMSKNNYVLKTYAVRHANAIDLQSYLLRSLAYEGGIAEVMGNRSLRDSDGNSLQFLFVTAPDFMIPGIDATIERIDVAGFSFHDGTGNVDAVGQPGAIAYVGRHRTAGELRSILIGTELGNVGQFYYSPFADPALNTIYLSENPSDIADDLAALALFDRPPLQAEFAVTIFEVDDDSIEDLGVDFDAWKRSLTGAFTVHEVSGDGEAVKLKTLLRLDASELADFLDYLSTRGHARVDTETKLLSINSEDNAGALSGGAKGKATASPAVFRSVRVLPFGSLEPQGAQAGDVHLTSKADAELFEGIELTILPFIASESITAEVAVTVNSLVGYGRDLHEPNVASRSTRSVVNLKPGTRYLLGSFAKETQVAGVDGIPVLMDVPFLGALFRRDVTIARRSTLVVFVQPTILTPSVAGR